MEHKEGIFRMGRCNVIVTKDDGRWHLSISTHDASPSYKELKEAKEKFLPLHLTYGQLFVPEDQHVNLHKFTHHLWEIVPQKSVGDMLTEAWEDNEYSAETTESFLNIIEEELLDRAVKVNVVIREDDNEYDE